MKDKNNNEMSKMMDEMLRILGEIVESSDDNFNKDAFLIMKRRDDFFKLLAGDELKEITLKSIDSEDKEKMNKIIDFYNQLICEMHNFIEEMKNEQGE